MTTDITDDLYTLESLSERLGGVPLSTLKHRIAQLGIPPAARGSRNKLLFDERAATLIEASDQLLRQGNGLATTRRMLGLDPDELIEAEAVVAAEKPVAAPVEGDALDRLSHALTIALEQLQAKDQQINQLQDELRRVSEANASYQQKVFYLQGEHQRLKEELKVAFKQGGAKAGRPWQTLFKRD
jgi:DNA-binding transcriptional MerR regulator